MCWGSWCNLRVLSKTEAPVFAILYVSHQWLAVTFICLSLGMITGNSDVVDQSTFINDLFFHSGDISHISLIMLGGGL